LNTVGIGGRVLSTKGFASLYSVGNVIPHNYSVYSFGAESGGMGPCPSFVMYEALVTQHDWTGTRGDPNFDWPKRSQASIAMGNYGATNMVAPWTITHNQTGHHMHYNGAFMDALTEWQKCKIVCQLSTDALVSTFEYTTLEAMDAGCAMILPQYYSRDMLGAPYRVRWLDKYKLGTSLRKATGITWHSADERNELVTAINSVAASIYLDGYSPDANYKVMEQYNHPSRLARRILETIG
jgi:hypothetical protein